MQYGLIGEHLPHSFSKEIHESLGFYQYSLKELNPSELGDFLTEKAFRAINVTIPFKQAVIPFLDEIDENAKAIGTVNTIVNRNGRLFGYNTDFFGMTSLIRRIHADLFEKKVLILGTGGTSKTARAVAEHLGAKTILRVSRSAREDCITYEDALRDHANAEVIINTTPVGMFPNLFATPIELEGFSRLEAVIDAIYNPLSTVLITKAKRRGINATGGLYMLVAQAVRACELFLDQTLDTDDLIDRIYQDLYFSKRNIVLIGMPSSGKSTVGKRLAEKLARPFFDTDEIIKHKHGDISAIFRDQGERAFRDIESEVVRELASTTGAIISTGGGAILREENVDALKLGGALFFLDRPLSKLFPTDDRPLSNETKKLEKLYSERYPIYTACADVIIDASLPLDEEIDAILTAATS